ncbi:hypothetical protein [uncultured Megasphaera sp.]|uniref:hypothetical protein n=1 Tax=uncultured Megasphaera sp. TaxID=165188 RepID=UPI00266B4529|nr:hypothetical protein [uncultured Megasphaera sp.]
MDKSESVAERLLRQSQNSEINAFWYVPALDFQKFGIVMSELGQYMAVKEKFRAILEYDPESDRYYVSLKFYGGQTPKEIHAYHKGMEGLMAKKK